LREHIEEGSAAAEQLEAEVARSGSRDAGLLGVATTEAIERADFGERVREEMPGNSRGLPGSQTARPVSTGGDRPLRERSSDLHDRLKASAGVEAIPTPSGVTSLVFGECRVQSHRYSFRKLVNFAVGRCGGSTILRSSGERSVPPSCRGRAVALCAVRRPRDERALRQFWV